MVTCLLKLKILLNQLWESGIVNVFTKAENIANPVVVIWLCKCNCLVYYLEVGVVLNFLQFLVKTRI